MEEKITKEFEESIKLLNLVKNSFEQNKKKLILLVKVKLNITTFKIYEKERIWIKSFEFKNFVEYRANLGFDGNWNSFFQTMYLSILRERGGDMHIRYPKISKAYIFL